MNSILKGIIFSVCLLTTYSQTLYAQDYESALPDSDKRSLKSNAERFKRGEITNDDKVDLAQRGRLLENGSEDHLRTVFILDNQQVVVLADKQQEGKVKVTVQVGGSLFDADYDLPAKEIRFDGRGHSLEHSERMLLIALAYRLEIEDWDLPRNEISDQRFFSYRFVSFLSDMPYGFKLEKVIVPIDQKQEKESIDNSKKNLSTYEIDTFQNCNEQPSQGNDPLTCGPVSESVYHDACDTHGWSALTESVGCNLTNACLGRCGEGCGGEYGKGTYATDCAEHDSCCRHHGGGEECTNPRAQYCGDEYLDAADDWLGGNTCLGCQPPPSCNQVVQSTETIILAENADSNSFLSNIKFPLTRSEARNDKPIFLEEWALLKFDNVIKVIKSSSSDYADFAKSHRIDSFPVDIDQQSSVLIIESSKGVHIDRHYSYPSMDGIRGKTKVLSIKNIGEFWFRAEVSMQGTVDRFDFVGITGEFDQGAINTAIVDSMNSKFSVVSNHRAVVFGRGEVGKLGNFIVENSVVITPQCCNELQCPPLPLYKCL